jgi:hypothetical protein
MSSWDKQIAVIQINGDNLFHAKETWSPSTTWVQIFSGSFCIISLQLRKKTPSSNNKPTLS